MARKLSLNKPGPHARDLDRFEKAAYATCDGVNRECHVRLHRANTGSVYVIVEITDMAGDGDGERVYRFASHSVAHTSHHYSVFSGGGAKVSEPLPPGYDGYTTQAIADVKAWAKKLQETAS